MDPPDAKAAEGDGELAKKRRGRKKSKLEDMFPAYLQEAFFGKTLLDLSKRAFLAPPAQRHSQGMPRPTLPAPGGRPSVSEPGMVMLSKTLGIWKSFWKNHHIICKPQHLHTYDSVVVEVENRAPEATLQLKREADGLKPQGEIKCKLQNQWNYLSILMLIV